jgi:crossover junction endodeoxyribonuclease RuvC
VSAPLRIVALDLSLRATGLATTHDSNGEPRLSCRTIAPPKLPADTQMNHRRVKATIDAVTGALRCKPDLVVIEWLPQFDGKGDTSLRLAELHGALKHYLWAKGHLYVDVMPNHLKQYATGNGNASKQQVREAITARFGSLLHIGTEDEADAVCLLAMALDAYGQRLGPTPTTPNQGRGTVAVKWPQLKTGALP